MGNILKIRDGNGKFIDIDVIRGANGKSAYEQALEGGYVGTEEDFAKAMVDLPTVIGHTTNKNNPHNITASDIGAAPAYIYDTTDLTAGSSSLETGKLYFFYE